MWSKAIIALLPLFYENANSVAMTKHAMTCITKEAIESWPNSGYYNRLLSLTQQIWWIWPHLNEDALS